MSWTMKAAVMQGIGKIEIENVEAPVPREHEVLIRVKSVGVCGSDVHYFVEGRIGDFIVEPPFILGHECSGEIAEVGECVTTLKPGDRVTVEPGVPCGGCEKCLTGRYNLCPDMTFWATPPVNGVFCEYVTHPAQFVFPVEDQVSFEEAAMVEPLAVGIYSVKRAQAEPGHTALVLGSGPIGLVTIQALIARGITEVIATDIYDYRLRKAQDMGAKYVFNGQNPDLRKAVREVTGGKGVDLVFETAGSVPTTQQTVDFSNQGARIVLIGLPSQSHFDFPIIETIAKELDILGIFRYANVYKGCVDLLNAGKVNLKPLITHRFSLENTQQALEFAHEHKAESIKAVINL